MGHRLAKSRLPCDFLSECGKVERETEPSAVMSLSLFALRRHTLLLLRFGCKLSPCFGLLEVFLFSRKSSSSVVTVERAVF